MKQKIILTAFVMLLLAIVVAFVAWQNPFQSDSASLDSRIPPLTQEEIDAGARGMNIWVCTPEVSTEIQAKHAAGEYTAEEVFEAMAEQCIFEQYVAE